HANPLHSRAPRLLQAAGIKAAIDSLRLDSRPIRPASSILGSGWFEGKRKSAENVDDRLTAVGDCHRSAGTVRDGHVRVDPQSVVNGGDDVAGGYGMARRVSGLPVGCSENGPRANSAAGHQAEAALRPVLAPGFGVDSG